MMTPLTRIQAQRIAFHLCQIAGPSFAQPLPNSANPLTWGILCRIPSHLAGTPLVWTEEVYVADLDILVQKLPFFPIAQWAGLH